MSRGSSQGFSVSRKPYPSDFNRDQETFGQYDEYQPPQQKSYNQDFRSISSMNPNPSSENIRLYVTIRKAQESVDEYKKLILMTSTNVKISLLKRQIEREFADLFPKEPTFICGKVEDQYGYALTNSSLIYELLKFGDRITVYPDDIVNSINNPSGHSKDGVPELHTSNDLNEILYLLKNVQQSLCKKLADGDIQNFSQLDEVLLNAIPLGFSPSRAIVNNVVIVLLKIFSTERLMILEGPKNGKVLNLLVTLLNFWIGEFISQDNLLLGNIVNLLEILVKSATFCESFKGAFVISNLMNASNLDFVSSQTKSRIIKIITYLSKGNFKDYYTPQKGNYVPSLLENRVKISRGTSRISSRKQTDEQPIQIQDTAASYDFHEPRILRKDIKASAPNLTKKSPLDDYYDPKEKGRMPDLFSPEGKLYKDYVALLTLGNAKEMHIFALQNLDLIIEKVIHTILDSKEDYLLCLNLVEIELPAQWARAQLKILNLMNDNLTEKRAADGLQKNIITRLLKAMSYQSNGFHTTLMNLLQTHLVKGRYRIDVSTVVSIIVSPYSRLHDFAIKALSIMSDPAVTDNLNYEIQFENHAKFIIELTLSKNRSVDFKNLALRTLAHLSLKEQIKPQILYNKGLETLIYHLRNENNIEGQRLAAKALLNLSTSSRDIKLKIVTELAEEVKKLHRNELDPIIQGYLQTLIQSSR